MTNNDLTKQLRCMEFPFCTVAALRKLEYICSDPGKQVKLQHELISKFVFGEIDKRKKRNMSYAIQELQLIEVLCDFFQSPGGLPADRNALFLCLYPAENPRYKILGNCVSLAISTQNQQVLNAAGIWLQQLGSTSPQSVKLARHILNDFFVLCPSTVDKLKQLPKLAPHFTANLLTAIGEVYKDANPPTELLKLIGDWISDNSDLPSLMMNSLALPTGGIPMTPVTPIAGLFRWCIQSPLRVKPSDNKQWDEQRYYSKIQQLLMDSVLRLKSIECNKDAVSAQHFADTARSLSEMLHTDQDFHEEALNLSVERFAQAISAVMSANCVYGNKQELLALLQPMAYQHFLIEWTLQNCVSKTT